MPTIDMVATGNRIRDLRNGRGLSTDDLRVRLGFRTPQAIFKWMRGDTLPTVDNLVVLADILGVTVDDILVVRRDGAATVA